MHYTQGLCIILCMAELRIPIWTLGDRLRKAREDADMSIQDMADKLGVHRNTVTAWEADRPIKPGMVRAWAGICDVDLDWLESGTIDLHEQAKRTSPCAFSYGSQDPLPFDDGEVINMRDHIVVQTDQVDSLDLYARTG